MGEKLADFDLVVVGLGYVGLPLVRGALDAGLNVAGFDVNAALLDGLAEGRSHIDDLSNDDVARMLQQGLTLTRDAEVFAAADAIVVCVPTPLSPDGGPDLSAVTSAMGTIGDHLHAGSLVVLESTTFPGTTEDIVKPLLEQRSGLSCGTQVNLAFSPERIDPGNSRYGLSNTPKVVGGLTPACAERAAHMYGKFVEQVVVAKGLREAETAKLLENTYRHVNIALVNELARLCHELDIDLWDVIRLAETKPFGFQVFYPGPGVGGHCIPIDPNYLSHAIRSRLGYPFRFVELAQEINATMPAYVVQRAQKILNRDALPLRGAKVLLLGITYKADVADDRESPAVAIAAQLCALGAAVSYHDPLVDEWSFRDAERVVGNVEAAAATADLVILLQAHTVYDVGALTAAAPRFFDTRGVTRDRHTDRL